MFDRSLYDGPERRAARPSIALGILSLLAVAGVAGLTVCPPQLRPHLGPADAERFTAYLLLGGVTGLFLPRRWPTVMLFVIFLAFGLEIGQLFVPGRDAVAGDAVVKAAGGVLGVALAILSFEGRRRLLHVLGRRPDAGSAAAPARAGA